MTAAATVSSRVYGCWDPPAPDAARAAILAYNRRAAKAMQNDCLAHLAGGDWPPLPCADGYTHRAARIFGPDGPALGGSWATFLFDSRDPEIIEIYVAAAHELADFINGWTKPGSPSPPPRAADTFTPGSPRP